MLGKVDGAILAGAVIRIVARAGERVHGQRDILDRAAKGSHLVERRAKGNHAVTAHGAIRGLKAHHAAQRRRLATVNPVMAKNLPVVGGLFEILQDNVSFFGDFSDHATTLEAVDTTETEGTAADTGSDTEGNPSEDTEAGQDTKKDDTAYTKTADGLTITCSEVYANSQAVYVTMQFKSE